MSTEGQARALSRRRQRLDGRTSLKPMAARYDSACLKCEAVTPRGARILWHPVEKYVLCTTCGGSQP